MSGGPVLLALDAAGSACSVVAAAGDALLASVRCATTHGQAERLMPLVERAMRQAGLAAAALDLVAVTVGPGSFTGIRVGLAAARGIALATGKPLFGVTGFAAVAAGPALSAAAADGALLVALESRREDLYVQLFERPTLDRSYRPCSAPAAVMPARLADLVGAVADAAPLLIAGDAAARAAAALAGRPEVTILAASAPDARGVWQVALARWRHGARADAARPLYLRPPGVTFPDRALDHPGDHPGP
jgi:tRNA threonylcarbamoyladenosine biosynthesis protein TsaB